MALENSFQKLFPDARSATADVFNKARIMCSGFGLSGNPENLIRALADSKKKDLTLISNNCGAMGKGLAVLLKGRQVSEVICSFIGGNKDLEEQYLRGEIKVELNPQGTLAERIRAGGAGIGAFYTPTGVGTVVATGKDEKIFNGRRMILETALKADFALIRAEVADPFGNLRFYRTSRNFAPGMAMAAKTTIVEAERLVPLGELGPDDIHLPGIFVKRVVLGESYENPVEFRTTRPA
jgi:3-oxoacid CoA-transferase subunit A